MVFKKDDENTKKSAQKGGLMSQKKHPEIAKTLASRRNKKPYSEKCKTFNMNIEHQRKAGKLSRIYENKAIEAMASRYDKIYQPFRVCDRICIRNGKIVFVEVKHTRNGKREKLKPLQEEFKNLCEKLGYEYEIINIDMEWFRNLLEANAGKI